MKNRKTMGALLITALLVLAGCPEPTSGGMENMENMVRVEGGSFQMGSTAGESDEEPVHPDAGVFLSFQITFLPLKKLIFPEPFQADYVRRRQSGNLHPESGQEPSGKRMWTHHTFINLKLPNTYIGLILVLTTFGLSPDGAVSDFTL